MAQLAKAADFDRQCCGGWNKLLVCGNGARRRFVAFSQHVWGAFSERPPSTQPFVLPAMRDYSLTAAGNYYGFDREFFARHVAACGLPWRSVDRLKPDSGNPEMLIAHYRSKAASLRLLLFLGRRLADHHGMADVDFGSRDSNWGVPPRGGGFREAPSLLPPCLGANVDRAWLDRGRPLNKRRARTFGTDRPTVGLFIRVCFLCFLGKRSTSGFFRSRSRFAIRLQRHRRRQTPNCRTWTSCRVSDRSSVNVIRFR